MLTPQGEAEETTILLDEGYAEFLLYSEMQDNAIAKITYYKMMISVMTDWPCSTEEAQELVMIWLEGQLTSAEHEWITQLRNSK